MDSERKLRQDLERRLQGIEPEIQKRDNHINDLTNKLNQANQANGNLTSENNGLRNELARVAEREK